MSFLDRMSVPLRLALIIASALLGVVVIAAITLLSERAIVFDERKSAVRQTVEIAHNIIVHHHAEATQGRYSMDEAQSRARTAIKTLRYSGDEYFFITDMHPRMVMHPIKPELDGKDLTQSKD
ncbi:MAG: cache domain-containing protein, partial [Aquabacterium sp.]|nr:cache domain-containing protein [Aquabacterium sp.]